MKVKRNANLLRALALRTVCLAVAVMPLAGGTINWDLGIADQIIPHGNVTFGDGFVTYTSLDNLGADYFNVPAGVNNQSSSPLDPGISYSPQSAPAGLSSFTLNLNDESSSVDASASLATGQTQLSASSIYNDNVQTGDFNQIVMNDQLTFSVGGTGSDLIEFLYTLDGNVSGTSHGSFDHAVNIRLGTGAMDYEGDINSTPFITSASGWDSFQFTNPSNTGVGFLGTLTVTNGETVSFNYGEALNCNFSDTCDFSNDAFSLVLPSDVTYTSASGVFLSQTSTAPEPASFAFVGGGFLALAWLRRRFVR